MDNTERIYKILNSKTSKVSVDEDFDVNMNLENTNRPIPLNDVVRTVNQSDVFNSERDDSNKYIFLGSIRQVMSNVLINITGSDSYSTVQNIVSNPELGFNSPKDIITEVDGWFSYKDSNCTTKEFKPKKEDLLMIKNGISDNWKVKITYPYSGTSNTIFFNSNEDPLFPVYLNDGIAISGVETIQIGGKDMTLIISPIKHGLEIGDQVVITGGTLYDGIFNIVKLGDGDNQRVKNTFVIDINVLTPTIKNKFARFKRLVNSNPSKYILRKFKTLIDSNNIDLYYASFSKTIFNDDVLCYNTNIEFDITNYLDYLGRPLTEVYLTFIKNKTGNGYGVWTDLKSGIQTSVIKSNYDIRQINTGHTYMNIVTTNDNEFLGDIIDYNEGDLTERVLEQVNHTFNSLNRVDNNFQEGYFYSPHKKIILSYFSNQVEYSDLGKVNINIPSYAIKKDGRDMWRDILSKGYIDELGRGVDYPFLNDINYVTNNNIFLSLKRQDPELNYEHGQNPIIIGIPCNIEGIEKDSQDVC